MNMIQPKKRLYRNDVSVETREKQSIAHQGRRHSAETKRLISQQLQKYWSSLPSKPTNNNTASTIGTIYGKKGY